MRRGDPQAERLRTAAFGKWHNTPDYEISAAGPVRSLADRTRASTTGTASTAARRTSGTRRCYENTTPDRAAARRSEVALLAKPWPTRRSRGSASRRPPRRTSPFFVYFAPGAAHAPHHVPKEWADKYKGKFDHGWDKQREITFEKQKKLGVIPKDTKLTPRPEHPVLGFLPGGREDGSTRACRRSSPASSNTPTPRSAGWSMRSSAMGMRDNTLIIYIVGDNGPSAEGSLTGTLNNMKTQQGFPDDVPHDARAHRRDRRAQASRTTTRCGGLGRIIAVPVDEAGRVALRRHAQRPGHVLAEAASRTRAGCARSSTTSSTSPRRSSKLPASPSRAW